MLDFEEIKRQNALKMLSVVDNKPSEEKNEIVEESEAKSIELVEEVQKENLSTNAQILKEHGGLESNIPVGSGYWHTRP